MVYQLQSTFNGVDLWYDSDIMKARLGNVDSSSFQLTFELNEGLYCKPPTKFTLKRNGRSDFNFQSPTHDFAVQGYFTRKINGVEYVYGVDRLTASRDSSVKKVELLVDSANIISLVSQPEPEPEPKPEPETVTVTKGDYATNHGRYSVKMGGVGLDPLVATLGFNDETVKVNKPKEPLDMSTVRVSFSEGEVFESGYVELYNKANTLLGTNALEYDNYTKTARYQYKFNENTTLMKVYITFHIDVPQDETVVPTFNHVYSMQPSELDKLVIEGFGVDTPSGTIDLRTFMLNLLSFPFSIPSEFIGEREKIVLGEHIRNTETTALKGDIIKYNLGSIEVPLKYKNAYDYYSAETTLILPYTENISLPPEYVIGATISIEYVVEVYKGTVNINVISSKTGKPIYNGTTSIGRQIPFISYWKILGDESIYTSVYNNQTKAIIEVKRKQPLQLEYGTDVSEYGTIGDYKGYIEVTEVGLIGSTMGGYEQEQLLSILNKGVIL